MLVYISHSSSDSKLFKNLRDECEAKGFTIVSHEKSFEFSEGLTERNKRRIELCDVVVIFLTAHGRSSYRVFQESDFTKSIFKDHFLVEGVSKKVAVKRILFDRSSPPNHDSNFHTSVSALEKLLVDFSSRLKSETFQFIYHTDIVY